VKLAANRIDRYLIAEVSVPFFVSIGVVVGLIFLLQARRLATAALGLGLGVDDAVVIFVSALPPFLVLALPIAFLLAVLIGLGRLAEDLELVALFGAGASPLRLARVPMILGAFLGVLSLPISLYGEPHGLNVLRDRLLDVGLRNLTRAVQPGVFNEDFRGNAVYASGLDEAGRLTDVLVFDERNRERPVLVTARRADFETSASAGVVFSLEDGELHLGEASDPERYDRMSFETAQLRLDAEQEIFRRTRFVQSPINRMTNDEMLAEAERAKDLSPAYARRVKRSYWRRYALPSMAFVFGILGAAIAISGGARARARNAILGIGAVVAYYLLTRVGDWAVLTFAGTPFVAAWGPNALMLALAIAVLLRTGRPR
jgi:lipopolysaccharide export system permease protein